jgi:Complex I intermediate-associated protein 30 (CIA30)
MNAHCASDKTLFDFQSTTESAAWQIVNEDVLGGVSASRFGLIDGLIDGAAAFRGVVSLENNGGFASVRSLPARRNLTGCDSFVIRLRGDGRRYKFTVRIGSGFGRPLYQSAFATNLPSSRAMRPHRF